MRGRWRLRDAHAATVTGAGLRFRTAAHAYTRLGRYRGGRAAGTLLVEKPLRRIAGRYLGVGAGRTASSASVTPAGRRGPDGDGGADRRTLCKLPSRSSRDVVPRPSRRLHPRIPIGPNDPRSRRPPPTGCSHIIARHARAGLQCVCREPPCTTLGTAVWHPGDTTETRIRPTAKSDAQGDGASRSVPWGSARDAHGRAKQGETGEPPHHRRPRSTETEIDVRSRPSRTRTRTDSGDAAQSNLQGPMGRARGHTREMQIPPAHACDPWGRTCGHRK